MVFKKFILTTLICLSSVIFSQAERPTIMVWPSDSWMKSNGYYEEVETDKGVQKIYKYKDAFDENKQLGYVIDKIADMFEERSHGHYRLKSMNSSLTTGRGGTAGSKKKRRRGKTKTSQGSARILSDINIYVDWSIIDGNGGPKHKLESVKLSAIDAYTDSNVATKPGEGGSWEYKSSVTVVDLLSRSLKNLVDPFLTKFDEYFADLKENGREMKTSIEILETSNLKFNENVNGKRLSRLIEDWLRVNTVKEKFSEKPEESDEFYREYEEVRIPLFDKEGHKLSATNFMRQLRDYLEGFGIVSHIEADGKATVYLKIDK